MHYHCAECECGECDMCSDHRKFVIFMCLGQLYSLSRQNIWHFLIFAFIQSSPLLTTPQLFLFTVFCPSSVFF